MTIIYPKLQFFELNSPGNTGTFDVNTAPKDLIRYGLWFPMIILVPHKLWKEAMTNLGSDNNVEIKHGVFILNGYWRTESNQEKLSYDHKYDIRKPEDFITWVTESLIINI